MAALSARWRGADVASLLLDGVDVEVDEHLGADKKPHAIDATLSHGAGVGENAPEERIRNSRRGAASITAESTPVLATFCGAGAS